MNASGADFSQWCDLIPDDIVVYEVGQILFGQEYSANATFWLVLDSLDDGGRAGIETQSFLISVFYDGLTPELRHFFVSKDFQRSLIYIDMPFMPVKETEAAAGEINDASDLMKDHGFRPSALIGVAAVTIDVNNLIVGSQWQSLGFALLFTVITLGFVFRDAKYAVLTTAPVIFTVAMQWVVMDQMSVTLSLVTVMIGAILVGVGVDSGVGVAAFADGPGVEVGRSVFVSGGVYTGSGVLVRIVKSGASQALIKKPNMPTTIGKRISKNSRNLHRNFQVIDVSLGPGDHCAEFFLLI